MRNEKIKNTKEATTYYMHTNTGSVDTEQNWRAENPDFDSLPDMLEVKKNSDGDWEKV